MPRTISVAILPPVLLPNSNHWDRNYEFLVRYTHICIHTNTPTETLDDYRSRIYIYTYIYLQGVPKSWARVHGNVFEASQLRVTMESICTFSKLMCYNMLQSKFKLLPTSMNRGPKFTFGLLARGR